jgi:hypothetical protein
MTDANRSNPQQSQDREGGFRDTARQRAIETYDSARDTVAGAGRRAGDGIDQAPLIALAGGIAAGALLAALLPPTAAERRAMRPVGKRVRHTAKAATQAARDAGSQRLEELGITPERGSEAIKSIFQGAADAAKTSAQAALSTAKEGQ